MSDKLKPGRGIELPFVELWADKPWRLKFNPFVTGTSIVAIWRRAGSLFSLPPGPRAAAATAAALPPLTP